MFTTSVVQAVGGIGRNSGQRRSLGLRKIDQTTRKHGFPRYRKPLKKLGVLVCLWLYRATSADAGCFCGRKLSLPRGLGRRRTQIRARHGCGRGSGKHRAKAAFNSEKYFKGYLHTVPIPSFPQHRPKAKNFYRKV